MTQAQLAEYMTENGVSGIHPQTVTKIEGGNRQVTAQELIVLSRILGPNITKGTSYQLPEEVRSIVADGVARKAFLDRLGELEKALSYAQDQVSELREMFRTLDVTSLTKAGDEKGAPDGEHPKTS